jgi:hypothetical protein
MLDIPVYKLFFAVAYTYGVDCSALQILRALNDRERFSLLVVQISLTVAV